MTEDELHDYASSLRLDTKGLYSSFWDERDYDIHPLFRDTAPTQQEVETDSLLAGLAAINHGDDVGDAIIPEEVTYWQSIGKKSFSTNTRKSLLDAVVAYGRAIEVMQHISEEERQRLRDLRSTIFSNRALCHYKLGNFMEAVDDGRAAILENKKNAKGYFHASRASAQMNLIRQAFQFCDLGCNLCGADVNIDLIKMRDTLALKVKALDEKQQTQFTREQNQIMALHNEIKTRSFDYDANHLPFDSAPHHRPKFIAAGILGWPIVFLIVEYNLIEQVEAFDERLPLMDLLETMFPSAGPFPEWDRACQYRASSLQVFVCDKQRNEAPVDARSSLRDILEKVGAIRSYPCFIIRL